MSDLDGHPSQPKRYRVLALDGGGIKGAYTASVLATLEQLTQKKIGQQFDLITGTSTGGIIAIAIGLGIPLSKVVELYVNRGPEIFRCPPTGVLRKLGVLLRHCVRPKHSQPTLASALRDTLGVLCLGDSKTRLVIPAFNAVDGGVHLFKTAHHPAYRMDYLRPAVNVALATAAAPTYFHAFTDDDGRSFIDGGVWANCPVLVGVVEAVSILKWPLDRLDILSIGTTDEPFDVSHRRRAGGIVHWNKGLIELFMGAQTRGTLGLAEALTNKSICRIDVTTRPGRFSMDNSREVSDLKVLGENSARKCVNDIAVRFLHEPVDSFIPHYSVSHSGSADPADHKTVVSQR